MKRNISIVITEPLKLVFTKHSYRVNWLRARARAQRWSEEREIIIKEMEWVIRTFRYMGGVWKVRAEKMGNEKPGHRAYAARETDR